MRKLILFFLFLTVSAEAAGPVAHVYFSRRFFRHFPERFNESEQLEFIVGTLFPDIRYLGGVDRTETHYAHMSLEEVLAAESPFMAGVKFHSYVDNVRNDFIRKQRPAIHKAELETPHFTTYLKLMEDEALFPVANWTDCIQPLRHGHPEECDWEVDQASLNKWHSLMSLSMQHPPSKLLLLLSITNNGFFGAPPQLIKEWRQQLPQAAHTDEMGYYVKALINHFEQKMEVLSRKS